MTIPESIRGGYLAAAIGLLLALMIHTGPVQAGMTKVLRCDGCSARSKEQRAQQALPMGTVHVFDGKRASVSSYRTFTEMVDDRPLTVLKETIKIKTDPKLASAWRSYVQSERSVSRLGEIELPDDFPVRSVAGVLVDPNYASGEVQEFLAQMSALGKLWAHGNNVIMRLLHTVELPLVDIQTLFAGLTLAIVFPDGSSMNFELTYYQDAITGKLISNLVPVERSARTADGRPVPRSAYAFSGRTLYGDQAAMLEWMELARRAGLVVRQGKGPGATRMVCDPPVDGHIYCRVVLSG